MNGPRFTLGVADERHLRLAVNLIEALSIIATAQEETDRTIIEALADTAGFHLEQLCQSAGLDCDGRRS